ncbi:MAG: ATP-binding cassette domain-containing protein [Fimbriimonadaceae bacterium]|jgi:phosphonate transport system permease protein|nr:ATP-binding cassette domain-containing protein [Fimbriimonadaceae bacterium]
MIAERPASALTQLEAKEISFVYPGREEPVLEDFSFSVSAGERVMLSGASGSGKTTLLRLLEGSLDPTDGTLARQGKIAMVYQDHRLVPESTVLANVCAGALANEPLLCQFWRASSKVRERALSLLSKLGLGDLASAKVSSLSGGQKQRVALARALISRADIVLADEPLAGLDEDSADEVMGFFFALQAEEGFALVCALHDGDRFAKDFDRTFDIGSGCLIASEKGSGWAQLRSPGVQVKSRLISLMAGLGVLGFLIWSASSLGFFDSAKFSAGGGISALGTAVARSLSQGFANVPFPRLLQSLLETVQMAALGTALGVLISAPLSFLALGGGRFFGGLARGLCTVIRTIPSLIWALLTVAVVGIGPIAGVLALAAYSLGYLIRFFIEDVENVDQRAFGALRMLGLPRPVAISRSSLPMARASLVGSTFFMFEYNVRAASVLGIVGAGGIGLELMNALEWRRYDVAIGGLILLVSLVVVLDTASRVIRTTLTKEKGI